MPRYSEERKSAVLNKLLPPNNRPVPSVSKEEGISEQTLYSWIKQLKEKGKPVPDSQSVSDNWSSETKFAIVVETASFSEAELSEYCREKGLYPEQVASWKKACMSGFQRSEVSEKAIKQQAKTDKAEIKTLKRELREKEKALAETAAILVLRKKLRAFYGEDNEDE